MPKKTLPTAISPKSLFKLLHKHTRHNTLTTHQWNTLSNPDLQVHSPGMQGVKSAVNYLSQLHAITGTLLAMQEQVAQQRSNIGNGVPSTVETTKPSPNAEGQLQRGHDSDQQPSKSTSDELCPEEYHGHPRFQGRQLSEPTTPYEKIFGITGKKLSAELQDDSVEHCTDLIVQPNRPEPAHTHEEERTQQERHGRYWYVWKQDDLYRYIHRGDGVYYWSLHCAYASKHYPRLKQEYDTHMDRVITYDMMTPKEQERRGKPKYRKGDSVIVKAARAENRVDVIVEEPGYNSHKASWIYRTKGESFWIMEDWLKPSELWFYDTLHCPACGLPHMGQVMHTDFARRYVMCPVKHEQVDVVQVGTVTQHKP